MGRSSPSFLCGCCKSVMCEDCISIAEEYQQLEQIRKLDMLRMEHELTEARAELQKQKRRAEMYEQVARAGLPDIIGAWIDQAIDQLIQKSPKED